MKHSPGFLHLVEDAMARVREVSCAEVARRLDAGERFELIDVREHEEWTRGHLPHARHLCKGILERDVETVVPDLAAPIVLYCGGGYRSALAADALQKMGYRDVASMAGGWRGWTEADLPVSRDA
jgi:rhodanese-related sulfurtransferase